MLNKYGIILFGAVLFTFLTSCHNSKLPYVSISGKTMGTFYHITYSSEKNKNLQPEIDSVLVLVNASLSTYLPESVISLFNKSNDSVRIDSMFRLVFNQAKKVFEKSDGAFDPTVMPLVNAWGFGFDTLAHVDSNVIDSLKMLVGFDKVTLRNGWVIKSDPRIMLDFSAIAKGFGVDVIAMYFENKGIRNYMVEIGGEVRVKGSNPKGKPWNVAIEQPLENHLPQQYFNAIAKIKDISVATSGNYRNYYYRQGKRYVHTINPATGYPAENDMLSASVFASDCMTADAWATAMMVLGADKTIEISSREQNISVYLLYYKNGKMTHYMSPSLAKKIEILRNQKSS